MAKTIFDGFKTHRPSDATDPGFTIPGLKFRWVSGRVRESQSSSALWSSFKKNEMPEKLVEYVSRLYPNTFSSGETIRRGSGELVLCYAKREEIEAHRKILDAEAKEQSSRSRLLSNQEKIGKGEKDYKNDFSKVTDYEDEAGTIPSQFSK